MHTFKDSFGREFVVKITVGTMRAIRDDAGCDLLAMSDAELYKLYNSIDIVDAIYVCVRDQATTMGMSDRDFGHALGGDSLADAITAFFLAYADFCPRAKRDALKKYLDAMKTMEERAYSLVVERATKAVEMDNETFGQIFTPSPESSD